MANNFLKFELDEDERNYKFDHCQECVNKIVLSTQGNAFYSNGTKCHFFISAIILRLRKEMTINQIRIKFVNI